MIEGSVADATSIVMTHCPYLANEPIQIINGSRADTTKFYMSTLQNTSGRTAVDESIKVELMNEIADEFVF